MENKHFKDRLIPEMQFLADIPTEGYSNEAIIGAIRQLAWPAPEQAMLDKIRFEDMTIVGSSGTEIKIRVYRPADARIERIVLWCHGGGFFAGNLETEHLNCAYLCGEGAAMVISPDYRLSPEHPYPQGLNDCYDSLLYAGKLKEDLKTDQLIVGGTSSGATLAASLCHMARDKGFNEISAQVLVVPPIFINADTESMKEFRNIPGGWNSQTAKDIWRYYLQGVTGDIRYAAPGDSENMTGLPPARIFTAELDPLNDEGWLYGQKLRQAGVPVEHKEYSGVTHFLLAAAGSTFYNCFLSDLTDAIRGI